MKRFRAAAFFSLPIFFASCATIGQVTEIEIPEEIVKDETVEEETAEEDDGLPKPIEFLHRGIKCEIEDMEIFECETVTDFSASGYSATRWTKGSNAHVDVNIPDGVFEILFFQKAFQKSGSHFFVTIDDKKYECYPSEPPLGSWELTLRTPIVFENQEPRTISVTIERDDSDGFSAVDFFLDYMQIVKIGEIEKPESTTSPDQAYGDYNP